MQYLVPCKVIRITESGKILLVESAILRFGIRNSAQGTRNPAKNCNLESRLWKPKYTRYTQMWNPESKTVLDELTWNETSGHDRYILNWQSC